MRVSDLIADLEWLIHKWREHPIGMQVGYVLVVLVTILKLQDMKLLIALVEAIKSFVDTVKHNGPDK